MGAEQEFSHPTWSKAGEQVVFSSVALLFQSLHGLPLKMKYSLQFSKTEHNLNVYLSTASGKQVLLLLTTYINTKSPLPSQSIPNSESLKCYCWVHHSCWDPLKRNICSFRTSRCLAESRCPATQSKASKSISLSCSTMPEIRFHPLSRGKSCDTSETAMWNADFWWWLLPICLVRSQHLQIGH